MTEPIKHIFDLVFDKTRSWGFKTAATISIIGFLFLTDILFSFSFNIYINNKISQLEKIQGLKESYQNDKHKLNHVLVIEKKVFDREHYSDFLSRNLSNLSLRTESNHTEERHENHQNIQKVTQRPVRSTFWMALSSNYVFAILLPFLLIVPFFGEDNRKAHVILGWFASLIMIGLFTAGITWISFQIPLILSNPIYNYILNAAIHTLLWILFLKISRNNK